MNNTVYKKVVLDLIKHEGCVFEVYKDSEGYDTYGIGHLVTKKESKQFPFGTPVSTHKVMDTFFKDLDSAIEDTYLLFPELNVLPQPVQTTLINMSFNLGLTRLSKFKKMIRAIDERDYDKAADEMIDSKWYRQVKSRGKELVDDMRSAVEVSEWQI